MKENDCRQRVRVILFSVVGQITPLFGFVQLVKIVSIEWPGLNRILNN